MQTGKETFQGAVAIKTKRLMNVSATCMRIILKMERFEYPSSGYVKSIKHYLKTYYKSKSTTARHLEKSYKYIVEEYVESSSMQTCIDRYALHYKMLIYY